jgi:hypothetical protein
VTFSANFQMCGSDPVLLIIFVRADNRRLPFKLSASLNMFILHALIQ